MLRTQHSVTTAGPRCWARLRMSGDITDLGIYSVNNPGRVTQHPGASFPLLVKRVGEKSNNACLFLAEDCDGIKRESQNRSPGSKRKGLVSAIYNIVIYCPQLFYRKSHLT